MFGKKLKNGNRDQSGPIWAEEGFSLEIGERTEDRKGKGPRYPFTKLDFPKGKRNSYLT